MQCLNAFWWIASTARLNRRAIFAKGVFCRVTLRDLLDGRAAGTCAFLAATALSRICNRPPHEHGCGRRPQATSLGEIRSKLVIPSDRI
jgi:hypothetical protein